jgi:prepilin-type N-terminal cleavage/methylation domain-containing protein
MNKWRHNKRGLTLIEIMITVIMICVLIATGILIHNKAQQVKVVNAIRDAVNTETQAKQNIKDYNAIVRTNCSTIQILIQVELADSDYKTVKSYLTTDD